MSRDNINIDEYELSGNMNWFIWWYTCFV